MRITCPECQADYDVEERLLRPGRATRCARCGQRWVPLKAEDVPAETPPADPPPAEPPPEASPTEAPAAELPVGPTAMDRLSAQSAKPKRNLPLQLAWVATILALLSGLTALYSGREAVMAAWPPAERLYGMFGLAPTPETPHPPPAHE
jgi:predicted Zn finger-like uncharacterized protein